MIVGAGRVDVGELVDGLLRMADTGAHVDGWGMAWVEDGRLRLYKSAGSCLEDPKVGELKRVESPLVVLHARKSKVRSHEETHPWLQSVQGIQYAFCYNGSFRFDAPDGYVPLGFVSDIFSSITPGGELRALTGVLSSLKQIRGANLVLLNPEQTCVLVRYTRKPEYYQMALSAGKDHVIVSSEPVRKDWVRLSDRTLVRAGTDGAYERGRL